MLSFIANKEVVHANIEVAGVLFAGAAWGFINYFSDGIPPYAAVQSDPFDLALQISAVAWCVIRCGAVVMMICFQIESVLADQNANKPETTAIAGHL